MVPEVSLEKPAPGSPRPHRRALTLGVVSVLILALFLAGSVMPVPYVSLRPGPTMNTIGVSPETKKPLIEINGTQTYPDDGHLNFTTVAYTGGPQQPLDLYSALRDWISPDRAVVPEETIFPKGRKVQEVEEENAVQMVDSQQTSVAAALVQLKKPVTMYAVVQGVSKGLPADGKLKPGDEVLAVNGVKATRTAEVTGALKKAKLGETVSVTVKRDGKEQDVKLTTALLPKQPNQDEQRPGVGVTLGDRYRFPFDVKISVGDIGGPSAGLMFAIGIYDLLTPGTLTGGKFIAGTGTITADGQVGPIGGIQQKMIAARKAGAEVFLVPPGNCAEATSGAPKGLKLIKGESLDSAIKALEALKTGAATPTC